MSKQLVSGKHRLRNTYWSLVGAASATILSVQPVMAETIWDRFSTIMRDIYGQLVGISTIVAVTVAAIALLVRMVSRNQRAVDEATSWLKRVVHLLSDPELLIINLCTARRRSTAAGMLR